MRLHHGQGHMAAGQHGGQEAERSHLTNKHEAAESEGTGLKFSKPISGMMYFLQQNCTSQSYLNRPTRDHGFKYHDQWGAFLIQSTEVDDPESLNPESWILSPSHFSI